MDIISPLHAMVSVDFEKANMLSVGLFDLLESQDATVAESTISCLLSVARLLAPDDQTDEEEVEFVKAMLDYAGALMSKGSH